MNLFDASGPREHAKTLLIYFMLAISVTGNVMGVWWYGGKTVPYIPVDWAGQAGPKQASKPGQFPTQIQTNMGHLAVSTLGNVTPDSLMSAIQIVRPYVAPDSYVAMHAQAKVEAETMRLADLSIMTTDVVLTELIPDLPYKRFKFTRMKFSAVRHLNSYGTWLKPHRVTVVVDVMPPQAGTGLGNSARITHLAWPPLKIKDGEFQNFSFQEKVAQQVKKFSRGVTR